MNIRDDDVDSSSPVHVFVVEPDLISAVPNGREDVNDAGLNHNLTLAGPASITDAPDVIK
jgi:hypothetical protein